MARTYTLTELKTRLDRLTDTENDTHIADAEKTDIINSAITHVYDLLVEHSPPDYYVSSATFATTSGTKAYALSTIIPAGTFYKIRAVYVDEGSNQLRPIPPIQEMHIQNYRPPQSAVNMQLDYIPWATKLSSGGDTFDGINGWEELVLQIAAQDIKAKREEDASAHKRKQMELEDRIKRMAKRDWSAPERVTRRRTRIVDPYAMYRNNIDGYRLRGGNLELYTHYGYVWV